MSNAWAKPKRCQADTGGKHRWEYAKDRSSRECRKCGVGQVRRLTTESPELCGVTPYHYRDNGEVCPWSGTPGWTEGMSCQNGCEGSQGHYANDGHAECAETEEVAHG